MKKRQLNKNIKKALKPYTISDLRNERGIVIGRMFRINCVGGEISEEKDPELFKALFLGEPYRIESTFERTLLES